MQEPPKTTQRGYSVEELPGVIVDAGAIAEGEMVIEGTYTASTGMKIPVKLITSKEGLIYRLWKEEQERRNPRQLTVEEDPSQLLADYPPQLRLGH